MNIFVLDGDYRQCAEWLCDKHVVKMVLEHTQMLCNAYYYSLGIRDKRGVTLNSGAVKGIFRGFPRVCSESGEVLPYVITHMNHPCTVWVCNSMSNFNWLLGYTKALCEEYTKIYNKVHLCEKIVEWMGENLPCLDNLKGLTEFAMAMPDQLQIVGNPIESYKMYYLYKADKMAMNWKLPERKPYWF